MTSNVRQSLATSNTCTSPLRERCNVRDDGREGVERAYIRAAHAFLGRPCISTYAKFLTQNTLRRETYITHRVYDDTYLKHRPAVRPDMSHGPLVLGPVDIARGTLSLTRAEPLRMREIFSSGPISPPCIIAVVMFRARLV